MPHTASATARLIRRIAALPSILLALALALAAAAGPVTAQEQSHPGGFSGAQVEGIEQLIRQYLLEHPEVLIESLTAYQQQQQQAEANRQKEALREQRAALERDPDAPVLGNPEGDVTIVEFFDYRCPYCRRVSDTVRNTVEQDGRIRLVMKEFPILGPQSVQAARAALASVRQGKYEEFHYALMTETGDMSDAFIRSVARDVGLDVEKLEEDMKDPAIEEMLARNYAQARSLEINGTPAFVIGDSLVPGAIDAATLKRLVRQARQGS